MARTPNQTETASAKAEAELAAALAQLRAEIADLRTALGDLAEVKAKGLGATLREQAADLIGEGGAELEAMSARAEDLRDSVRAYARANPDKALAAAAGLGLLFGLIFGRR